jgi:hypothetical protein
LAANPTVVAEAIRIGEAQVEADSSAAAIAAAVAQTDRNREKSNASNAKRQGTMRISAHKMPMLKNKSIHHQITIPESIFRRIKIKIAAMKIINNQGIKMQMVEMKFKTPLSSNYFNQQMIKFL